MPGSRPRALIAEDETVLREELRERLAALWPELDVVAYAPDVAFLDIRMPRASGLHVARAAAGRCHVVFVTAYDEFAVQAFEQGAVDYLLKPFGDDRMAIALQRLRGRLASPPADLRPLAERLVDHVGDGARYLRWINAQVRDEVRLLTVDEVCYFQSDLKYTRVVTRDEEALIRRPVRELRLELNPERFRQVHRSIIVNMNEVAGVRRDVRGHVTLKLRHRPEALPVSEPYAPLFRAM
jgi:DNA-binding LytR/AlgR family response regulator